MKKKYSEVKPLDIVCHKIDYSENGEKRVNVGLGNAHTHGMTAYGKTDICLGIDLSPENTEFVLNTVAELICNPNERFDMSCKHLVDDGEGNTYFQFFIVPAICFDEPSQLIVLADENGFFPNDNRCSRLYKSQLKNHHDIEILKTKNGKIDFDNLSLRQRNIIKNKIAEFTL